MDNLLEKSNEEGKKQNSKINIVYKIYHFIAKIILYSLLIILILIGILFALYFIDMKKNIKEGESKQPLFGAYIIISPSMVPTINVEDAIIIQRKDKNELKIGDIITFMSTDSRYSGLTITHRIVGIEKSKKGDLYFRTKGDNNNAADDALVSYENIYGKVILKIPMVGYLQHFLTKSYGLIFLVVIPCVAVIIYDIIKILKSIKQSFSKKSINKDKKINKEEKDKEEDTEIL